jgi:hypothetical protein
MTKTALLTGTLLAMFGCTTQSSSVFQNSHAVPDATIQTTICEIRENRNEHIGTVVRTTGTFVTDGMTFSFFVDRNCGTKRNSVNLSSSTVTPPGDDTVRKFWEHFNTRNCWTRKIAYCNKDAKLDVVGRVVEDKEGFLQIQLMHIYRYELVD